MRRPTPLLLLGVFAGCTAPTLGDHVLCATTADCVGPGVACVSGLCVPAAVAGACPPAEGDPVTMAGPVRVFAVGQRPTPFDALTYDTWSAMVAREVHASVVPNLASDRPNLLAFPAGTGLLAATLGTRGTQARSRATFALALSDLTTAYASPIAYYTAHASTPLPPGRALALALTDTLWRMVDTAYVPLATSLHAWVAVTLPVAQAMQVTDPAVVAALADPDVTAPTYAWVAVDSNVYNQTLFVAPDGTVVAMVPEEQPSSTELSGLAVGYGPPGSVRGVDFPFGRVAVTAGDDARAPDVLDRVALDGVQLLLQPSDSPGWAGFTADGAWLPDGFLAGGWSYAMRDLDVHGVASACLSTNVFEQGYDCQSAVLVPGDGSLLGDYIGELSAPGFASVAAWAIPDDASLPLTTRRMTLAAHGAELLPGGPLAGQYAEGTGWYDLDLGAPPFVAVGPLPTDVPVSTELATVTEGEQRRPDLAVLSSGTVVTAWEDTREGCSRVFVETGLPGALTPGEASPRTPNVGAPRAPRLATAGIDTVAMVWQEDASTGDGTRDDDVYAAVSTDGGMSFLPATRMGGTAATGSSQDRPAVAIDPTLGTVFVAWTDTRSGPSRLYVSQGPDGAGFDSGGPVEPVPTAPYDATQDQWAPAIAALNGEVVVAWADHRTGAWTIEAAVSPDGGETWAAPFRVDDAPTSAQPRDGDTAVWIDPTGGYGVAWTDLRTEDANADVRFARVDGGVAGASTVLPRTDTTGSPQWAPSLAQDPSGALVAVWQDLRAGVNHVYMATSADGGRSFASDQRVDDGPGASQQYAPRVAPLPEGGAVAVWIDDRTGVHRVRVSQVE